MANTKDCYQYTDSGLKNVWLVNGFTKKQTPYGEAVGIDNLDGLHKVIATTIINKRASLTGDELRFLRIELDLSQKAFAEYFGKTDQSVANWEKSDHPPKDVDYLVRHIYRQTMEKSAVYTDEVDRLHQLDEADYNDWLISFQELNGEWGKAAKSC